MDFPMQVLWTKKAEKSLDKILQHTIKNFSFEAAAKVYFDLKRAVSKLSDFPYLGRRIGGYENKRQLIVSKNTVIYEIVVGRSAYIVIRSIRPRKTKHD